MSELTQCNWCTLQGIIARYKDEKISLQASEDGWITVFREAKDGVKQQAGYSFMALTLYCAC